MPKKKTSNWRNRIVGFEEVDPKTIKMNPLNYKDHPDLQKRMMGGLFDEIGWVEGVIINKTTGNLLDGHMRVQMAVDNDEGSVPALFVELTQDEETNVLATLDPVGSFAKEKRKSVEELLARVNTNNVEIAGLIEKVAKRNRVEFGDYNPEDKENDEKNKKEKEDTELEDLVKKWGIEFGQLWRIKSKTSNGYHLVKCGDSVDQETVMDLCNSVKATLMATDPPYGVNFEEQKYNPKSRDWDNIEGDTLTGNSLRLWFVDVLEAWLPFMDDKAGYYIWSGIFEEGFALYYAIKDAGLHVQSQIVWEKNAFSLGQADYQWMHENCWYGFKKGTKHYWNGGRDQTTVWSVKKISNSSYLHPMQKPVELYEIPIKNHTKPGDVVFDPFLGSGTQIEAAENLGRICYGMEKDPKWVATSLERMAGLGLDVELIK